ncbi:MAG: CPBP family intramembrane glutamic endopeptidase [Candidatus Baltobacteraceae bacterium]
MNAENGSTSIVSPGWPTHWREGAFKGSSVALLVFGLIGLAVACAVLALIAYIVVDPSTLSVLARSPKNLPVTAVLIVQLAFELPPIFVLMAMLPRVALYSWEELGLRIPTATTLLYVLGGFVAAILVGDGGSALVEHLTHHPHHMQDVAKMFEGIRHTPALVAFVLYGVLVAPIAEELIFRGFLFNLGLRYGNFWVGAIFSSLLFGAAHGDLELFLPLSLVGFVLATVYYRSKNLIASMLTHASFNAIAFTALSTLRH